MAIKGINCVSAHVSDLQRSKRFYGEALGWGIETNESDVAGFSFGEGYLVIHSDNRSKEERLYAGGMRVLVQVEDAAAEHIRLKANGVQVSDVRDQPWGMRTFTFSDPDGYTWEYGQSSYGS
jgi:catechol 2,3-dioxygenase-like lactoylglutathione lyase family enzyme